MTSATFEPAIPGNEWPQTNALDGGSAVYRVICVLLYTTLLRPLNAHDWENLHINQRAYLMFSIIHTHTLVSVLVNIKQSELVF